MKQLRQILLPLLAAALLLTACNDKGQVVKPTYGSAHAKLKQAEHHFGTIGYGTEVVDHDFVLMNDGKTPLVISNVTNHCSCTHLEYSTEPIAPGHAQTMKAYLHATEVSGDFIRSIDIHTNGGTVSIHLSGRR